MSIKKYYFKLTLPCDISCLDILQSFVRGTAQHFGFSGDDIYRIELGLEEGVVNIMKCGSQANDEPDTFDIICERVKLGMRIIIKEKSFSSAHDNTPLFDTFNNIENISTSGIGLFLMRKSMDEVAFYNLAHEGKETHLTKFLPRRNIETYLTPEEQNAVTAAEPSKPTDSAEKISYTVRKMYPDEALEVSRCAYLSNGNAFFNDHIYYPDRIIELNASEEMISAVAVTQDNTFIGHGALVYPEYDSKIAEFTFVFVNQAYRNQGFMEHICKFLLSVPKKQPLTGVYTNSIASQEITQRGVNKLGFKDCAILLASIPATSKFKEIAESDKQRISIVVGFNYIEPPTPKKLYAPPHHRNMITRIYENILASHFCSDPETNKPVFSGDVSIVETSVLISESCAEIWVKSYGSNIVAEVKTILRDLCLKQIESVNLCLSLEDSATWFMTEEFEKLGFFFAGILPESFIGDVLILQYLNDIDFDYDKVKVYCENTKELLAYIKAQDPKADM